MQMLVWPGAGTADGGGTMIILIRLNDKYYCWHWSGLSPVHCPLAMGIIRREILASSCTHTSLVLNAVHVYEEVRRWLRIRSSAVNIIFSKPAPGPWPSPWPPPWLLPWPEQLGAGADNFPAWALNSNELFHSWLATAASAGGTTTAATLLLAHAR